jgi:hypothetical protein
VLKLVEGDGESHLIVALQLEETQRQPGVFEHAA